MLGTVVWAVGTMVLHLIFYNPLSFSMSHAASLSWGAAIGTPHFSPEYSATTASALLGLARKDSNAVLRGQG